MKLYVVFVQYDNEVWWWGSCLTSNNLGSEFPSVSFSRAKQPSSNCDTAETWQNCTLGSRSVGIAREFPESLADYTRAVGRLGIVHCSTVV